MKSKPWSLSAGHKARRDRPKNSNPLAEGVFVVEGSAAIKEYLRFRPQWVQQVFVKERQLGTTRKEFDGIDIKLTPVPEEAPDNRELPGTPVWAHVKHQMLDMSQFEQVLNAQKAGPLTILALDHISDPRNLGAIVRSAAFFGVKHIFVPERRQVLLTQSGVGTAQGGFALCDLVVVVNLSRALEQLKELNFWILGAAMDGDPVDNFCGKFERQVVVLGSEDKGISPNVLNKCDAKISISGAPIRLESLNVSVAAGILLHRLAVIA